MTKQKQVYNSSYEVVGETTVPSRVSVYEIEISHIIYKKKLQIAPNNKAKQAKLALLLDGVK